MSYYNFRKGGTVLVVEDDANILVVVREYLSRAGFQVLSAPSGWDALKVLREQAVDAIIAEQTVSQVDGSSLREKCVLKPETREIPFLFLVPGSQTENQVRALRSGIDDVITKPFDPIVLVARLQAVLERRIAYLQMVRVDPLTRMLNRPTLEIELTAEISRMVRYERNASMVLIDADHFAELNQESGDAMGDLMLTCFSGVILKNIRNVDIAGRYHGEKFLMLLPETPMDGCQILASRIQEQLSAVADSVAAYPMTFTCAMLHMPEHADNLEDALARIEHTLAKAKEEKVDLLLWEPAFSPEENTPAS